MAVSGIDGETRSRQNGLVTLEELGLPISIIGAGSIGSFTALALAKLGCSSIRVYDHDVVEPQNIGCQLYGEKHLKQNKAEALSSIISELAGVRLKWIGEKWTKNDVSRIVVCAVDSQEERRKIWKVLQNNQHIGLFIDGRMGGELMAVYCVDMANQDDMKRYEKVLAKKVEPIACSERSIVYNTFGIASIIAKNIKSYVKGQEYPYEVIFDYATLSMITSETRPYPNASSFRGLNEMSSLYDELIAPADLPRTHVRQIERYEGVFIDDLETPPGGDS